MKGTIKIANVIYEERSEYDNSELSDNKRSPDKLKEGEQYFDFQIKSNNSLFHKDESDFKKKIIERELYLNSLIKEKELKIKKQNFPEDEKNYDLINPINYKTAYNFFIKLDFSKLKKQIELRYPKKTLCNKCFCCYSSSKLKPRLNKEREFILCLSKLKYEEYLNENYRILSTIYNFLTKKKYCLKEGEHWESIGFQNIDPKIDLEQNGMLGPFQILYLIEKYPNFSNLFYQFLFINRCEWLFCSILLNLTNSVLDVINNRILIQEYNKREHVLPVLNDLFCGMCYKLYHLIKSGNDSLTAEFISNKVDDVLKLCNHVPNLFLFKEFTDLENNEKKMSK